jgi:uncharacterized membrane protein YesL
MGKLFDQNHPLMRGLTDLGNVLLLSVCWVLFSIPVLTIGPATDALYYGTQKVVNGENIRVFRCFLKSFRENLKQGILLTIIFGAAAALIYYDFLFSYIVEESLGKILRIAFIVLAVIWVAMVSYTFPLQAQFQNSLKNTLKNAMLLSLVHLGKTVQLVVLHLIPIAVCLMIPELFAKLLPIWLFGAPGLIAFFSMMRMKKVWQALLEQAAGQEEPEEITAE